MAGSDGRKTGGGRPGRRVVVVADPRADLLDVAGPCEVFSLAADAIAEVGSAGGGDAGGYAVEVVSAVPGVLRVETAHGRLGETDAGLDRVARECGFGGPDSMRRSFLRVLRVAPSAYRGRFSAGPDGLGPGTLEYAYDHMTQSTEHRAPSTEDPICAPVLRAPVLADLILKICI